MIKLLVAAGACFLFAPASPAAPVRIMPLGDSITESTGGQASYRYWLWHDLLASGYDVDFVGSETGVRQGQPLYPDFDQDHEGHWGWWTDLFFSDLPGWAAAAQPDVVLVHLGTNDLYWWQSVASTVSDLTQIVSILRDANPDVTVLLAQIIPGDTPRLDDVPWLNNEIAALAPALSTPESPVIPVDQFTGFDPGADTYDGVHPNESGEQKMAARWFAALDGLLPVAAGVLELDPGQEQPILLGAFPNPFTSQTSVSFRLRRAEHVRLTVHDVAGRCITTLLDARRAAGMHRSVWDGRAGDGAALPEGVYFLRLVTESGADARKCVRAP